MSKYIDLIFTRDFSLFMSDFWQNLLSERIADEFGAGIRSQIAVFDGRAVQFFRVRDELNLVKQSVISQILDAHLFSQERTRVFRSDVDALRTLLEEGEKNLERFDVQRVNAILDLFRAMYPQYMLAVFLPNAWREDFLMKHPDGEKVLQQIYENRVFAEGMFEHADHLFRSLIRHLAEKNAYDPAVARVIRWQELESILENGIWPSQEILNGRLRGYIFFQSDIITGETFKEFLTEHGFLYDSGVPTTSVAEIRGQTACAGQVVVGKVQLIMNADEAIQFAPGNILVTSMTSPEYVPAMKSAVAIVTDEGGITCHAAIVSRELGIPCIIGTKIATKVLKDGDMVQVDAERGYIKKVST